MKTKRLLLVLLIVLLLFLTSQWWVPWLLLILPAPSNKADFIQSLDSLFNIASALVSLALVAIGFIWIRGENQKKEKGDESPLRQITLDELRKRSGSQGSRINWIDRGATKPGDLRAHGRIVIAGRMKLGKTREAAELIRRVIDDDQIAEDRIFEPSPTFRYFSREKLLDALKGIDPHAPILLLLDDFPFHYTGESLERLSDLLLGLQICKSILIIATARLDQLTDEHYAWLKSQKCHEIRLPDLNVEQTARILDSAIGIFNLQVDDDARTIFIENRDGTPELTLIALRHLHLQEVDQVTAEIARHTASESLTEVWAGTRRDIEKRYPAAKYLLDALSAFHSVKVRPSIYLVLEYANYLWHGQEGWGNIRRMAALRKVLTYLSYFDFFMYFDVFMQDAYIAVPDVVVDDQINANVAGEKLGTFLLNHRRMFKYFILRPLYSHADAHAAALANLWEFAYYEKKDYRLALHFLDVSLGFDDYYAIHINLGATYHMLENYPAALAEYDRAIDLQPKEATIYYNRGITHNANHDYATALINFNKAIELRPDYAAAYTNRGLVYDDLQDYSAALSDFTKAIELQPDNINAYNNRGITFGHMQNHAAAVADFTKVIELQPNVVRVYNNRGRAYIDLKDYAAAVADFTKVIEIQPDHAEAYINRGAIYETYLQDYPAALADFAKTIEIQPNDAMFYFNRGNVYAHLGNYSAALADLTKTIEIDPHDVEAYSYRSRIYYSELKDYPSALADLTKAIKLDINDGEIYYMRGNIYTEFQNYPFALADYTKAIEFDPQNAKAYGNRGNIYRAMQDYSSAIDDYTDAIKLHPQYALPYNNRGVTYIDLGNYPLALVDLTKAIELNPQNPAAYANRGNVYTVLKNYPAALIDLNKAIELDPDNADIAIYNTARFYGLQAQTVLACIWLRRAILLLSGYLETAKTDMAFDSIRDTPEFQALLREF
ncbi:MAG: tetratricopeptide repeat protein [Anaerolineales bacterium]